MHVPPPDPGASAALRPHGPYSKWAAFRTTGGLHCVLAVCIPVLTHITWGPDDSPCPSMAFHTGTARSVEGESTADFVDGLLLSRFYPDILLGSHSLTTGYSWPSIIGAKRYQALGPHP